MMLRSRLLASSILSAALAPLALPGQNTPTELTPRSCGPGVSVTLADDVTAKFDLVRACALYGDLIAYHLPQARERPGAVFHVVKSLDCTQTDLEARISKEVVACSSRSRTATEIWIVSDEPLYYAMALLDGLDYANRLYTSHAIIARQASEAIAELRDPELRKQFHGSVSAKELKH